MNVYFWIAVVVIVIYLNKTWARRKMCQVSYTTEKAPVMAERDEIIPFESTVLNVSSKHLPFIGLMEHLPETAELNGSYKYVKSHIWEMGRKRILQRNIALKPFGEAKMKAEYSLSKRGIYHFGDYSVYAGDLLGLRHALATGYISRYVAILPRRVSTQKEKAMVSSFIGDIEVKRFFLEDPLLTVGFSDYTGREPMRDISWTRTAVSGKMMVKNYNSIAQSKVMIVLNVEGGTPEDIERCYELVRMAIESFEEKHIPYSFITNGVLFGLNGGISYVASGGGGQHYKSIMYALAGAEYVCRISLKSLVFEALKDRTSNEQYLAITVPTDDKGVLMLQQLRARTGAELCILEGRGGA